MDVPGYCTRSHANHCSERAEDGGDGEHGYRQRRGNQLSEGPS
jgi:hypothetical protein